mmetsp:Transcript_28367/g.70456  ORF Transcript_28367/g.70456 Transcript_28367/m.70456 type:complete len:213 (-) Transcript_28367:1409-2047(-)
MHRPRNKHSEESSSDDAGLHVLELAAGGGGGKPLGSCGNVGETRRGSCGGVEVGWSGSGGRGEGGGIGGGSGVGGGVGGGTGGVGGIRGMAEADGGVGGSPDEGNDTEPSPSMKAHEPQSPQSLQHSTLLHADWQTPSPSWSSAHRCKHSRACAVRSHTRVASDTSAPGTPSDTEEVSSAKAYLFRCTRRSRLWFSSKTRGASLVGDSCEQK